MLGLRSRESSGGARVKAGKQGRGALSLSCSSGMQDAGDLGVWSSPGALPLRPSRCSAALRPWAGRRPWSGAGLPSRVACRLPSITDGGTLPLRSCLYSPPLTLYPSYSLHPTFLPCLSLPQTPPLWKE